MMKNHEITNLRDENILTLFTLNNFVVPEIQREYVWGDNEAIVEKFINEIFDNAEVCGDCGYAHGRKKVNVGFLYSYKPPYITLDNDRYLEEFLIDGQQRITTLFLLLLHRAVKEGRVDDFLALTRVDGLYHCHCFCYKVRELTQQFLDDLIEHIATHKKDANCLDGLLSEKEKPSWFLSDYQGDPTVSAILKTIQIIDEIDKKGHSGQFIFNYVLQDVYFWHFKTEITSQGEELYITMNSRGEQLSQNEMEKAKLLPADMGGIKKWGQAWEEWQTLFWRNRDMAKPDTDADAGFNSFLSCIIGMKAMLLGVDAKQKLKIEEVEQYVNALAFISGIKFRETIDRHYPEYNSWYDDFLTILWGFINRKDIDDEKGRRLWEDSSWILPSAGTDQYKNATTERNRVMLLWPWMYYWQKQNGQIDEQFLIRLIRMFYTRFKVFRRSASVVGRCVDQMLSHKVQNANDIDPGLEEEEGGAKNRLFSEEEVYINDILSRIASDSERRKTEQAIWKTQDIPFIQDGRYVGGDTIYVFLKDKNIIDLNQLIESLKTFRENLDKLKIDQDKKKNNLLKYILLLYKVEKEEFWARKKGYGYYNYEISLWKRIVRTQSFRAFYVEFFSSALTRINDTNAALELFLKVKRREYFNQPGNHIFKYDKTPSDQKIAIVYSICGSISDNKHIFEKNYTHISFREEIKGTTIRLSKKQPSAWMAGKDRRNSAEEIKLDQNWKSILEKECCPQAVFIGYPEASKNRKSLRKTRKQHRH